MKLSLVLMIKMTIGFMIGMLVAVLFKLPYFYTAGVIAVLSLEPTRKQSTDNSIKRVISSLLGLGLAVLLFYLFGYNVWVLFLLVAIFIPLSFFTKIEKGIVVSLVLISQIYLEKDLMFSLNAIYILLIGVVVALLLNLYMPRDNQIINEIKKIDKTINSLIQMIANKEKVDFSNIDNLIKHTYQNINIELENINVPTTTKRLKYIEMRSDQVEILKRIEGVLIGVKDIEEKEIILSFLKEFDGMIGEDNYAEKLSIRLDEIFEYFRTTRLPGNREYFEQRAQLYFVLIEISHFLTVKIIYHEDGSKSLT